MTTLELKFLGEFGVIRDGRALPLPPSKKTRALLAYLCMQGRRMRREQLCELLWEVPDDPRGSLRWSLSKLRRLLDDDERERIVADRSHVEIDLGGVTVDAAMLQSLAAGTLLEGLEFSDFHDYHAWCIAEREHMARAQGAILRETAQRLAGDPERALAYARALVCLLPYDEPARAGLIRLLVAAQHLDEAEHQFQLGMRMLKEAGITSTGALREARQVRAAESASAPAREPIRVAPTPPPAASDGKLVGREEERRVLAEAWAYAVSGRAGAVLLRGEPGLGKSSLLDYVGRLARAEGGLLLRASACESDQIRPFALWIDALRGSQPESPECVFGAASAESREALFARLCEFVGETAGRRPVALLLDDVHWCDESSAAALHYGLRTNRERPVLAVLAARESEMRDNMALQQALRGLRRDELLRELRLGPLAPAEIEALLQARMAGADSARLARECGGNPLLALELARAELASGESGLGGGSLDELVRERLARFDPEGAEVLRWAAVLGPAIDVPALLSLSGIDGAVIGQALEEAERQAVLVSSEQGLRFAHNLIARAIYAGISPVRRQLMHHKVATWLEQDPSHELARAADLAHHASLSGDAGLAWWARSAARASSW